MTENNQYLVFKLDKEAYGINIKEIYEVLRLKEILITEIPNVPKYVEGIINLRGNVIPLINLRAKLKLEKNIINKKNRVIIVNLKGKKVGILVDKILKIFNFHNCKMFSSCREIKCKYNYIKGLYKKQNYQIFILNINNLFDIK
ncbi:chemotaxis protein CheW [Clostridium acetireducens DSM 10703]|uniref:Chemotaxis protein CheW n=1 Tax=Clostridium acetireducens DSM 10703 TaxID=1121290 RepID=A0A1E8EZX5_9CLOT|nr:chemotaxis protein CheW [Clostridium acetireducens]OFI06718.1 chemotaxis protein CheW [Clostridium acetireducens DSM 10703]